MVTKELNLRIITATIIGFIMLGMWLLPTYFFYYFLVIIAWIIIFKELPILVGYHTWNFQLLTSWHYWLLTTYVLLPFSMMSFLNENPVYRPLLLLIFLGTFAHDIGAYFIGKYLGKHLLCPQISPKKTWEGFAGGWWCMNGVLLLLSKVVFKHDQPISFFILLSLTLSCCATLGDLFESWLKRQAKIKDAGNLLPGHGGLLDRFDSIIFVTIFVFIYRTMLADLLL